MEFAPAYMYLIRFAEKLFATSSFHFSCLGRHNPNCMTYVPPTLNVLFPCTPPSSPRRWRSRFLRDRNYAINYFVPYLSFLSLPFFCLLLELLSSLFLTAITNLRNNQKVQRGTYFIRDTAKSFATRENYFLFF